MGILVGQFFGKLVLILSFIQCNIVAALYIIIFHMIHVFKSIKKTVFYTL